MSTAIDQGNFQTVKDILLWKDPTISGVAFLCLDMLFYLIVFGGYTLLTILSWIGLTLVAYIYVQQQFNKQDFPDDDYEFVSRETLEVVLSNTFGGLNSFLN